MLPPGSTVRVARAGLPLGILLVDDSAEFIESAARFLATDPDLRIVGRAFSGWQAIEQIDLLHPDLVLVDLMMPEMNGLELTGLIKSRPNPPRVIIVSLYGIAEYAEAAEAALADGWVAKSMFGTTLLELIHRLFARPVV